VSAAASIYAVLNADDDLTELLTGGFYAIRELPANAFNKKTKPDAWDSATGEMKPSGVLRGRPVVSQGRIADMEAQVLDTRQVIEIYLYEDRLANWEIITEASNMIYGLLQGKYISGAGIVTLTNQLDDMRAPEYSDACMMRLDYTVEAVKVPQEE
jgi:hypothetical protein